VWFAWAYAIGGAGTFGAFIFAALLRRSQIITTAELIELRYSGDGAAILRGFKGVYFGVISLAITMGWVIRSVVIVSQEALGWNLGPTLVVIIAVTIVYTTVAGFWGVAITDFIQFFVGTAGSLALAYFALREVGGLEPLKEAVIARYSLGGADSGLMELGGGGVGEGLRRLQFIPRPGDSFFHVFIVFVTLKWWGNPPASLTQRIMATKDERHATFSMVLFAAVHFAVNYWPMIIAALVSLVTFPDLALEKAELGYAKLLVAVLPPGVLGVMLASLTAAFMSTIDTQANTGASFIVNDIYRRFIRREASDAHYVRASQVSTVLMLLLALVAFFYMSSVRAAWEYLATMTAGYGFVVVARWFWWRITAWAEMAALIGSAVGSLAANHLLALSSFGTRFLFVSVVASVCWIVVALFTRPPDLERLAEFCRLVRPYPALWGPVRERYPDIDWSPRLRFNVLLWGIGIVAAFTLCFGIGHVLLGSRATATALLAVAGGCLVVLVRVWRP